jgi:hypothetical protein
MKLRLVSALFLLSLVGCQTNEPEKRNFLSTYRGVEATKGPTGNTALVKASDPKTFDRYNKVLIEPVRYIAPRNPDPKHKGPTREEARKLTSTFDRILREELGSHYQLTNRRSRDTLIVRAALTELRPSEPGLFIFNYLPYAGAVTTGLSLATGETLGAGSNAVEAEAQDSLSRRQVYALVERTKGGKLQPSGLERWGQSEQAMRVWSRKIRRGIQKSTATSPRGGAFASRRTAATSAPAGRQTASRAASSSSDGEDRRPLFGGNARNQTAADSRAGTSSRPAVARPGTASRAGSAKPGDETPSRPILAGLFKPKEDEAAPVGRKAAPKAASKPGSAQTKAKGKGFFGRRNES